LAPAPGPEVEAPAPAPLPDANGANPNVPASGVDVSMVVSGLTKDAFMGQQNNFINEIAAVRTPPVVIAISLGIFNIFLGETGCGCTRNIPSWMAMGVYFVL
jgi:hypothetical protein